MRPFTRIHGAALVSGVAEPDMPRHGNNPKRRIAPPDWIDLAARTRLAESLTYVGSAHHKRRPGDYGLHPPTNPRPWKSLCDSNGPVLLAEARGLLRQGILKGMFSIFDDDGEPKYVWSVDESNRPYEAKVGLGGYHGYLLEDADDMSKLVLREWARR